VPGSLLESLHELTVADVMLATPMTLPSDTTVAEARAQLANTHVQMLLLADGDLFRGAVTGIPDDADPAAPALGYVDREAGTISPTEPAEVGYERTSRSPQRRLVVLDPSGALVGLICLNPGLTGFCRGRPDDDCR
jgi:CBS-domain-containing membrane protein